ncbi:MAG: hypothetical protein DSZ03_06020 [Sulfurimonas sp.]|nr:MAG: hypothetical protein DSZ03_06020 [Sulfurimonas sp.]
MKYFMMILIVTGSWQLQALELSFTALRFEEKTLALKAFKKLYKERRNVHKNMRQVMKHARAKSLKKNHLSFFQPKASDTLHYNEEHLFETNGALVILQTPCDGCILPPRPDNDVSVSSGTNTDAPHEDSDVPSGNDAQGVRPTTISPWALR